MDRCPVFAVFWVKDVTKQSKANRERARTCTHLNHQDELSNEFLVSCNWNIYVYILVWFYHLPARIFYSCWFEHIVWVDSMKSFTYLLIYSFRFNYRVTNRTEISCGTFDFCRWPCTLLMYFLDANMICINQRPLIIKFKKKRVETRNQ